MSLSYPYMCIAPSSNQLLQIVPRIGAAHGRRESAKDFSCLVAPSIYPTNRNSEIAGSWTVTERLIFGRSSRYGDDDASSSTRRNNHIPKTATVATAGLFWQIPSEDGISFQLLKVSNVYFF